MTNYPTGMEDVTLIGGQKVRVHSRKLCEGRNCCVHNPSSHHMIYWYMNWRSDRKIMERICSHGIGHPDPDDADFQRSIGNDTSVHGCDGCCLTDRIDVEGSCVIRLDNFE